jgi:two-component system NarL family sensor kinase
VGSLSKLVAAQPMKTPIAIFCLLIVVISARSQDLALEQQRVDSISEQIAQCKEDTNKVNLLLKLAYHQFWLDTTIAKEHVSRATVLSNKLNYTSGHARSFLVLGNFAEYVKHYERALEMYNLAAVHAEKGKLYAETHDAYISLMNIHFYRGEYVYALDVCLRGLKLAKEANDLPREANYTNLSGFIYRNMKQSEDEEKAFRQYSLLASKSGDSLLVASSCTELAQVMMEQLKFDSALLLLDSAYEIYSGHYEQHRRAFIHYLYARINLQVGTRGQLQAFNNSLKAIEISRSAPSNEYDVARYYIIAGKALIRQQIPKEAIHYLDTGLAISIRIRHRENIRDAYLLMSDAFNLENNVDSAFYFLQLHNDLNDSILNEENLRTIAEMKARFQLEQKDRDLLEFQEREKTAARNRILILSLIAFTLIIIFLVYNRYRLKQKNSLQLTINQQQNDMFQGILSAQEKERQRIAGDLHDGLGSLLSTAKLQLQLMGNSDLNAEQKKHYEAAVDAVNRSSQDLRSISHSIMPAPLKKLGLIAALESVIAGLNVAGRIQFHLQSHNMEARIEEEKELALYNITMELINNAAKHSEAKNVMIQFVRHESNLSLTIEDDGKGFDPKTSASGIGLSNIQKRVDYFKGQLEIDSKIAGPTTISIEVPVS